MQSIAKRTRLTIFISSLNYYRPFGKFAVKTQYPHGEAIPLTYFRAAPSGL